MTADNQTPQKTSENSASAKAGLFSGFGFLLRDLFLAVILAGVVILFIYQPVKVEGTSMMPALVDQERIFINKFIYRVSGSIERGEMVVFWYPGDQTKSYVKRVIALPGDMVRVDDGQVFVNGEKLDEPYVPADYRDHSSYSEVRVPDENFYVLGDHRSSSNDSRAWGTVPRRFIYGKAVFVYWPLDKMGTVR